MEVKESMGLPPSGTGAGVTGAGVIGSFNGMLAKVTEAAAVAAAAASTSANQVYVEAPARPDATRPSATTPPSLDAGAAGALPSSNAPIKTSSVFMSDMSTAIIPHSGATVIPTIGTAPATTPTFCGNHDFLTKRKRGRPRKYAPDGTPLLKPFSPPKLSPLSPIQKKGRGRPPGSGKKQQLAALGEFISASGGGVAGFTSYAITVPASFTPHAITIPAGEDVAARIMSFSHQEPRGVCILSANGAISNVTLWQPSIPGGSMTYEGRFEILTLKASFLVTDSGGTQSRTGGLSVSLVRPDGKVIGGCVAGMLKAATPVQVVIGSFLSNTPPTTTKKVHHTKYSKPSRSGTSDMLGSPSPGQHMNEVVVKQPDSPQLNQSSENAASSSAESPKGQMIAVQSVGGLVAVPPENRRNMDIDISLPAQ